MDQYLIIPIKEFNDLDYNEIIVLSQLVYIKKAFETLTVSNAYLGNKLNLSKSTMSRCINKLNRLNYIKTTIKDNTKREISISKEVLSIYQVDKTVTRANELKSEMNPILKDFLAS